MKLSIFLSLFQIVSSIPFLFCGVINTSLKNHICRSLLSIGLAGTFTIAANAQKPKSDKVSHAEPLYLDLVRDLGARKGEKEFNIGAGFTNRSNYSEHGVLAEYEFAPLNRLGFEVETDCSFFRRTSGDAEIPGNKLECLKLSAQYSFFVSSKHQATLAVGYTQVFEFADFKHYGKSNLYTGAVYSPFFIGAKRWGNVHSLVYACPLVAYDVGGKTALVNWQLNTSFHYTIPHTKHFIGIELNKEVNKGNFEMTIRPQVKVKLNDQVAIGVVTGFPVHKKGEGYSSFFRLIYEP